MLEPNLKHLALIICQHHAGNVISVTENNHVSLEMVGVRLLPSRTRLPNSAHASVRWPTTLRVCSFASSSLSWLSVIPFLWFAICRTTTLARAEDWVTDVPLLTSSVIWRQDLTSIPAQLSRASGSVLEMLSLLTLRHTCGIVFTPTARLQFWEDRMMESCAGGWGTGVFPSSASTILSYMLCGLL